MAGPDGPPAAAAPPGGRMETPAHRARRPSPSSATLLRALFVGLAVGCTDLPSPPVPPPPPGTIRKAVIVLTINTMGDARDPDGYKLVLDQKDYAQLADSTEMELT